MKIAFGVVAALVLTAGGAEAGVRMSFPPNYNPYTGRTVSTTGRNPITGAPVAGPAFQPVVGSVTRHSHFANPFTGAATYRGDALDPNTGRLFKYKFRQ